MIDHINAVRSQIFCEILEGADTNHNSYWVWKTFFINNSSKREGRGGDATNKANSDPNSIKPITCI